MGSHEQGQLGLGETPSISCFLKPSFDFQLKNHPKKPVLSYNSLWENKFFKENNISPPEKLAASQYSSLVKTKSNEIYAFGMQQGQFGKIDNQPTGFIKIPTKIAFIPDGNIIGF